MAQNSESDVLIIKAAQLVRKAAQLDTSRSNELVGVADYLESIPFEGEIDPTIELPEPPPDQKPEGPVRPFKVRLTR